MRYSALAVLFALSAAPGSVALAQETSAAVQRADASLAEAVAAAHQGFERTQAKEFADWLRVYEKALEEAKKTGDPQAIAYIAQTIARSKAAGRAVKPPPPGATYFQGRAYLLLDDPTPWESAKRRCERMGGHLVTFDSGEEEEFVIATFGDERFWIGAGDFVKEGDHAWLDGSPFKSFGRVGRFDNGDKMQHAIYWEANDDIDEWRDATQGYPLVFVCEWEP